ncbi:DUF4159 domain-containing protein [Cognatishimia sp. SS12]|uniref:DUF4159 domain-containing protein n=1 Tax=Cognatishimia sp. SS12 TaxID=2979465 RepID=UPI00232D1155|nr:DUF4159 domain-containing protein [Cognatishimia sp. SS12]MDC0737611.1 DUF4159 domain-containing protein [Cognatishimia sp. SS12]
MLGLPLAFSAPWVLTALIALPILWFLLRAVPPAPIRKRFPGVVLLLGLQDDESTMDRTPWWLLLMRMLLIAAVIIGFSGPVLQPDGAAPSGRPLLVVMDGDWAAGPGWARDRAAIEDALAEAERTGRTAAMLRLTAPEPAQFLPAGVWVRRVAEFAPLPWTPSETGIATAISALPDDDFDTLWVSSGLAYVGRTDMLAALEARGQVAVLQRAAPLLALDDVSLADGVLTLSTQKLGPGAAAQTVSVIGEDPNGAEVALAQAEVQWGAARAEQSEVQFALPAEMRGRISHFRIDGVSSAGARFMTDDRIRRREVALVEVRGDREGLELLSPTHFLRQALVESAEVIDGAIPDIIPANPDVIILADVAALAPSEEARLLEWTENGGLLLRFAGPQMAASDLSRAEENPLMPVRLRAGGRTVGGAMSWGEPKALAPFSPQGPFAGLKVPDDVRVTAQVLAQPDPNLADRVLAELNDGTPLVTRKPVGAGQVVLFHVTANAEWSGLPLSGLFVQMLDRLAVLSAGSADAAEIMAGTIWTPIEVLDGLGRIQDGQTLTGVEGAALLSAPLSAALRPGVYRDGGKTAARNVLRKGEKITLFDWPAHVAISEGAAATAKELKPYFLSLALVLLLADTLAALILAGRLSNWRTALIAFALVAAPSPGDAQATGTLPGTDEIALAYVLTGNAALDDLSYAGLYGLSDMLYMRTSVEPVNPVGVDLAQDELAFYPFLYWPISPDQSLPSDTAYEKLNDYLRSGGLILFDTRDADVAELGASSPNGRKLQAIARALDIPALEPVPGDHVLTRTFYLLQDFPGRYAGRGVWVEAAPPDAEQIEGMPFRNLNDGVTPVVIGGNDWAAAWATDTRGTHLYPVGRGSTGARQRELAYRFGINLIMHVLTGNYKSDQVHVPALLDRLGQ